MRAEKAVWLRPACGYVAAAVCLAIAAWGASRPPPTLGFVQVLDHADSDALLPLEQFAIEAGDEVAALPRSQPETHLQPQPQPTAQPDQNPGTSARNRPGQAQIGFVRPGMPRRESDAHGYYREIDDWRNWT
ncbi:hypothetical protein [Paraburkholderia phytofirmans]|uniref:hypothetical protein n=1 Tax=Paraburkholderia phytofirmans TaxID=261302 RepID=UPI0038BE1638